MGEVYLYNDEMWRVKHKFTYTGEPEQFTLRPGRYLCIAKGAHGGGVSVPQNCGGTSYGILNLAATLTAYAVVGGVGGDGTQGSADNPGTNGDGGYNGGGRGGLSCDPVTYKCGSGGGGASDIRLSNEGDQETTIQHQVPNWLTEVEYIRSDKTQYINTGVIGTNGMGFDIKFTPHDNMSTSGYGTIFGAESDWKNQEYILTTYTYTGNSGHFGYGSNNIPEAHMVKDVETVMSFHNDVLTVNDVDYSITEPASFTTPNAITIFQLRRPSEYREAGTVTLKYFKLFNPNGECIRYFVPFVNTGTEIDISNVQLSQGTINSTGQPPGADNDDPSLYSIRVRSQTYIPIDPVHKYISVSGTASTALEMHYTFYDSEQQFLSYHDGWVASGGKIEIPPQAHYFRFVIRRANENAISVSDITSVGLKYYESTVVSGLYDLVNDIIYEKGTGNNFTVGNPVQTKTIYNETKIINIGLNSRIMVAGGGGGASLIFSDSYSDFTGFGGGVYGGYPCTKNGYNNNGMYPNQTSGYSFGIGQDAPDKNSSQSPATYGAQGIGGGGGGWFGGYSSNEPDPTKTESSCNGGGGSGYILTSTSYKPPGYMTGITPRDDLNFTDTLMTSGSAYDPCIMICESTTSYHTDDTLICDCIGTGTRFTFLPGSYRLKCNGGSGAVRTKCSNAAKGGYAEGVLNVVDIVDAFAYVGGTGLFSASYKNASYTQTTHPTLSFNGGGKPSAFGDVTTGGEAGGGGTDIRIGTDSLYARVIVAGGGGGTGRYACYGGAGGGTQGDSYNNQSGNTVYGENYGPGKQNAAGSGSTTSISGRFGYGGNGASTNGGYGGAGGGGWYGGSGTYPDGSADDEKGGCGGSGYVLTEESYKPSDYMLNSQYYLSDTILTTGGANTLRHFPITAIEIDVLSVRSRPMICHDSEGYKYYDDDTQTWTYLKSTPITVEDFEEYGTLIFVSDNGLGSDYVIYAYDPDDDVNQMIFTVLPPQQTVSLRYHTDLSLSRYNVDLDVDETNVDFNIKAHREGVAEDAYLYFDFTYDIHDVPIQDTRVYCIQGFTQGASISYHEPQHREKTLEHIDLLPVGKANRMPARYKNYIGSFIDGSTAITGINSAVVCEHNRCIYSATLCNNTTVRFAKLNLVTNTSTIIKDIPKSQLGDTFYGDIKVDDNYIYLTSSVNDGSYILWRTPNSSDTTVNTYTTGNSDIYKIQAGGKMEWYDDHTLLLMMRKGLALFDTNRARFTLKMCPDGTQNSARRDMAVGEKYVISVYSDTSNSAWVIDKETADSKSLTDYYGQTWAGTYRNSVCYHDGTFYAVQRNRLHFLDEESMTITYSTPAPFTDIDPKQIVYGNGVLYITIQDKPSLYMFDIATRTFYATGLPFTVDNWLSNGWIRMCAFKGYCFIPQIKLYTINFVDRAKYNLGYKYDQFIVVTNRENAENPDNQYVYDNRFVTFTDDNMWIHKGDITYDLSVSDPENNIKSCSVSKSQYNKFLKSKMIKVIPPGSEEEDDESEENIVGE